MHIKRGMAAASAALVLAASVAGAQDRSPVADMLGRAKAALNDLDYESARSHVRPVLDLAPRLKRGQQVSAYQVAAAIYYPEDATARMVDSAIVYLDRLARLSPSAPLPVDLAWRGIDSLLAVSRERVFGATAEPPYELTLSGTEARPAIEVASTRPARWQLFLVSSMSGAARLLDTLPQTRAGRLSLRAHDGREALIMGGEYELRVLAIDAARHDTVSLSYATKVTGAPPTLAEPPDAPDPAQLLPERERKALGRAIGAGLFVGGATWAMANFARAPRPVGDMDADRRAVTVGVAIGVGALVAGILDPGRPLPENVRKNQALRDEHMRRLGETLEENRKRVREYRAVLTIDPEAR